MSSIKALHYHTHEYSHFTEIITLKIYTPLAVFSWDRFISTEDTNSLLATAAAQAEIVQLLIASLQYLDANQSEDQDTNNLVARGLKHIRHWMLSPFHVRVFLTCLAVDLVLKLLQRLNCWTYARRYVPLFEPSATRNQLSLRPLKLASSITYNMPCTMPRTLVLPKLKPCVMTTLPAATLSLMRDVSHLTLLQWAV